MVELSPAITTALPRLNGDDLRRDPLEVRKATLASILAKARPGIRFNGPGRVGRGAQALDVPASGAFACKQSRPWNAAGAFSQP
jgi:hypothetical protein